MKKDIFKVSIIIPVYNTENYLERCIISVTNQTYSNLEILLIDNNSTDNSLDICKKYAKKDNRIIVLNEEKPGVSCVRNNGLKKATGDFITFVDGDDYLNQDAIENMLSLINKYNTDAVRTLYNSEKTTLEYEFKKVIYNKKYQHSDIKNILINQLLEQKLSGYLWILLLKKDIAKKILFNEDLFVHQDLDFYLKLFLNINDIYISDIITYNYCDTTNNSSSKKYYIRNIYSILNLNKSLKNTLESHNELDFELSKTIDFQCTSLILSYLQKIYYNDRNNFKFIIKDIKNNNDFKQISKNITFNLKHIHIYISHLIFFKISTPLCSMYLKLKYFLKKICFK